MILFNGNIDELKRAVTGENVVLWGAGKALRNLINDGRYREILKLADVVVDRDSEGVVDILGKDIPIFKPRWVNSQKEGFILVTSTKYYIEIFHNLMGMGLSDQWTVALFVLVDRFPSDEIQEDVRGVLLESERSMIPKTIHTFWFSNDVIPEQYKFCLDSWRKYCPDFDIKIWNQNTYDCNKHPFVKEAIKARKWAFASDYARLDVINQYGGIYLDMDIQLLQGLNSFTSHEAVFAHYGNKVDLAFFSSVRESRILQELLLEYDSICFDASLEVLKNKLIQPKLMKKVFDRFGVAYRENVQKIGDILVIPGYTFFPWYWFDWTDIPLIDTSYGVHHCNAGWIDSNAIDERHNRERDVIALWSKFRQDYVDGYS